MLVDGLDLCSFDFPTVQGVVIIAVLSLNRNYRDTEYDF